MKDIIKLSIAVTFICILAGAALIYVHTKTAAPISLAEKNAQITKMSFVLPEGVGSIDSLESSDADVSIYAAKNANNTLIAYAVVSTSHSGFGGDVRIIEGVNTDGSIIGVLVDQCNETPGVGDKVTDRKQVISLWEVLAGKAERQNFPANHFLDSFNGKIAPVEGFQGNGDIDCIGGATISSRAVIDAVNKADRALLQGRYIPEKPNTTL